MQYLAYHFTVEPPQPGSEILMAMISDEPFESFDTTETGFIAYIKEEDAANIDFKDLIFEDFTFNYKIEKIAQVNWNAEWEKNFEPVRVDDLLLIRAPFHVPDPDIKYEIVIMPKMSFGTGHHQTTQLMCAAMFETELNGMRVLDMGCGTGILAILACMLGAKNVLAIDIDEWSVENSRENCRTNNCPNIIVKQGDVDLLQSEDKFDIILANINKNILKKHLAAYSAHLSKGGKLFLSGFFTSDVEELKKVAESNDLKFVKSNSRHEWAMMVLERV